LTIARHALVHGTPVHLAASLALDAPTDLERTRVVDNGFAAQHLAELVIPLQPVILDPVLDAGAGQAVLLAVGEHLAIEARVQAAAQERQDVLSAEVQTGMIQQAGIEFGQGVSVLEQDIGTVFSLVDDPVIALAL
jgi:hypothetical protein